MTSADVVIVGAGISGASMAHYAARSGRNVLLLERAQEPGGCLRTVAGEDDFWFELGGHTFYNSYGATIELLEACDALSELQSRAKPALRFLQGDEVLPGKNLGLLLRQLRKFELLRCVPRWFGSDRSGKTVRAHFSSLVGASNYERVLGPMLSAVPSQRADEIPAEMLFKKRPRRKDVRRSFTFARGARTLIDVATRSDRIETRVGQEVVRIDASATGFQLTLTRGAPISARVVVLAIPPQQAAKLLEGVDTSLAQEVQAIEQVAVDSLGLAVRREQVALPEATFYIPLEDSFHSVVTRDVVPHDHWRAFTFHFRPGLTREERIARAAQVLRLDPAVLNAPGAVHESQTSLPSPRLQHFERVAAIDSKLAGKPLALTGNWFGGLSVEDCVLRSRAEWQRVGRRSGA